MTSSYSWQSLILLLQASYLFLILPSSCKAVWLATSGFVSTSLSRASIYSVISPFYLLISCSSKATLASRCIFALSCAVVSSRASLSSSYVMPSILCWSQVAVLPVKVPVFSLSRFFCRSTFIYSSFILDSSQFFKPCSAYLRPRMKRTQVSRFWTPRFRSSFIFSMSF